MENMRKRVESKSAADNFSNIDALVGAKLRNLRLLQGMSQDKLAQMIGVSFQQVQKYEKGVNRLSAGRLAQLASIFKVPVQAFFGDDKQYSLPAFVNSNDLAILDHLPRMSDEDKELIALFVRFLVRHRARSSS